MNISKGNHFLHLQHGIGKVQSIQERSFYGCPEASYVQMYFARDQLTVTVLESDLSGVVRDLITAEQAKDLLGQVKAWKGKPESKWKVRANANQAALDSGDPFRYVKVAKALAQLDNEGTLRLCDKQHFNQSLDLLTEELAAALKKSPQQARKLIDQAISA